MDYALDALVLLLIGWLGSPFIGAAAIEYRVVTFKPNPSEISHFLEKLNFPFKQIYASKQSILTWGDTPTDNLVGYLDNSTKIRAYSRIVASLLYPCIILFIFTARFFEPLEGELRQVYLFFALVEVVTIIGFSRLGRSLNRPRS
jgi:hypothetical protein